jgi:hypothetical protein
MTKDMVSVPILVCNDFSIKRYFFMINLVLKTLLQEAEIFNLHGLLFQYIALSTVAANQADAVERGRGGGVYDSFYSHSGGNCVASAAA